MRFIKIPSLKYRFVSSKLYQKTIEILDLYKKVFQLRLRSQLASKMREEIFSRHCNVVKWLRLDPRNNAITNTYFDLCIQVQVGDKSHSAPIFVFMKFLIWIVVPHSSPKCNPAFKTFPSFYFSLFRYKNKRQNISTNDNSIQGEQTLLWL